MVAVFCLVVQFAFCDFFGAWLNFFWLLWALVGCRFTFLSHHFGYSPFDYIFILL